MNQASHQSKKVIIVGGGAAGLYAGYVLKNKGVDFVLLEANSKIGGRVQEVRDFVDLPIDIGAEWIHTNPVILRQLLLNREDLSDATDEKDFETIVYRPKTWGTFAGGKRHNRNILGISYQEWKFKCETWHNFLATYIAKPIQDHIHCNTVVKEIHYANDQVKVVVVEKGDDGQTTTTTTFTGDKVIVAVPLKVLQDKDIKFSPPLPKTKHDAFASGTMAPGLKVFMEFSQRFYPDMQYPSSMLSVLTEDDGGDLFYDAVFGKETDRHVLGLFSVGQAARKFKDKSDSEIIAMVMSKLDEIFDGQATKYLQQHVVKHWSKTNFIKGAYSFYGVKKSPEAKKPIDDKIYFAGEFIAPNSYLSTVHGAALSGKVAVENLMKNW